MSGHVRRRGEQSFELKFDLGRDPNTGERQTAYHSFKGTKRQAQARLTELMAATLAGTYVEPSKVTVADFVRGRIEQWNITPRTAQRYRELLNYQILPYLGGKTLQRLSRLDIEAWHKALSKTGLGARTIGNAHRVLSQALGDAERDGIVTKNICKLHRPPKPTDEEMVIVRDVPGFIAKIHGTALYVPALLALTCGLRLGEVLALRNQHVDLQRRVLQVREALEHTKAHGTRIKAPKTKAGRRDITLPDIAVTALAEHRRRLLETRMKLGAGRLPDDALLFATLERHAAASRRGVCTLGRDCGADWYAGNYVSRTAAHACQSTHRQRRRYCHHCQAPWTCKAKRHAFDLRPHVSHRRQQGRRRYQRRTRRMIGWHSGGKTRVCSFFSAENIAEMSARDV
jgi:integrase